MPSDYTPTGPMAQPVPGMMAQPAIPPSSRAFFWRALPLSYFFCAFRLRRNAQKKKKISGDVPPDPPARGCAPCNPASKAASKIPLLDSPYHPPPHMRYNGENNLLSHTSSTKDVHLRRCFMAIAIDSIVRAQQPFKNAALTDFTQESNRRAQQEALEQVRNELGRTYPLIIGGKQIESDDTFASVNPAQPEQVI